MQWGGLARSLPLPERRLTLSTNAPKSRGPAQVLSLSPGEHRRETWRLLLGRQRNPPAPGLTPV